MSALIGDVLDGKVSAVVCNAAVNAGGKILKVVEMQMKYGTKTANGPRLSLGTPSGPSEAETKSRIAKLEEELAALKGS